MQRVLIIGAGGFGREVYFWLSQHPDNARRWQIGGFIDDRLDALAGHDFPIKVISTVDGYRPEPDDLLVCGIGLTKPKQIVCEQLKHRGGRFMQFIHPTAIIGGKVEMGEGVVICPGVILTCCIKLGDFVMLNVGATVGHDAEIGNFTTLSAHCDVTGHCQVGAGVFMGSRASLVPGTRVGDEAVVGAGAVVISRVAARKTVFGNPAKVLAA